MTLKRCYKHRQDGCRTIMFTLVVFVLLINIQLCKGIDDVQSTSAVRARVFTLNNISAQKGKWYLKELGIGDTILPIPGATAISVTGRALELIKAGAVLGLVDSKEEYVIKEIALNETDAVPSCEELNRKLGPAISVGSLISRGDDGSLAKAIVDKNKGKLIIIATKEYLSEITKAVEQLKDSATDSSGGRSKFTAQSVAVPKPLPVPAQQQSKNIAAEVDQLPEMSTEVSEEYDVVEQMIIPNGDDLVDLDLPEKVEIVQLIELVGKLLNLDYLYDETKVVGHVTVKIQKKMKIRDLYKLLESVLKFKGFVMSRKGNLVTIVPAAEALDTDPVFSDIGGRPGDVVITRVFSLDYITTAAAKQVLTEMKLGASINEIPETGAIIVTEYAFRMDRIEQLLGLVDVPGESRAFKLRELRYTLVSSLVPKLKDMASKLGTISVTVAERKSATKAPVRRGRTPPAAKPAPATAATATQQFEVYIDYDERTNRVLMIGRISEIETVEELIDALDVPQQDLRSIHEYVIKHIGIEDVVEALQELEIIGGKPSAARGAPRDAAAAATAPVREIDEPQVVEMESTNSLLVNATPEQHIQIAQIISYIDREPEKTSIPYRLYRLENQEPEDLATTLNKIIEETIKDKEGKIQKKITREEDIAIVPDEKTFSLIVYASKKNQEWIGELIEALDKRRPQVLIDVSLVEISKNDTFQYDLDLVSAVPDLTVTSGLTSIAAINPATIIGTIAGAPDRNYLLEDSSSGGTYKGFYGNNQMMGLLTLMQEKGYGRIMAQPKVLVNDNEEGKILTTEKTHVKEVTVSYPGDGTNPATSEKWTPYEAKIELRITPQISEGELLRLEIEMIREDFIETVSGPPDYATSNINTVVTVPDGSTIILGGLTKLNQKKGGGKVPLVGDIPIVGTLFRSVDNSDDERKLYIFVKANILRPDDIGGLAQLKKISRKNKAAFEKAESQFQEHKDFPGFKATIFEPKHVLEQMEDNVSIAESGENETEEVAEAGTVEFESGESIEYAPETDESGKFTEYVPETEEIDSLEVLE